MYIDAQLLETVRGNAPLGDLLEKCLNTGAREIDLWDLTQVFDAFGKAGTPAVILVDSWDLILKNQNYWGDLFHTVRALGQRLPRGVVFVVAAQRPLLELWVDQMGSIYYNTFASALMGSMDESEIRSQVKTILIANGGVEDPGNLAGDPAKRAKIDLSIAAAQELVVQASDGHPWLVSFVACMIAKQLKAGGAIDRAEVGEAIRDRQRKVFALIRDIRAALTTSERTWLDDLIRNRPG